ncbi:MAG: PQQ-binding-like beta-propeller repeat protein [Gammaproteobacteria bacterium]|nr:PQQ-binding-like beta-propeller repeat protein [Gammaproteobacteria bacterium]MDH4253973.1 PQQ-binding-like beta-propeller repeat protein [Gammaproteobacteria bacterium]MDH5308886.1 PQQ-binding-like beta-propeller repeat protein [Gammaproteobacteria bacterium]
MAIALVLPVSVPATAFAQAPPTVSVSDAMLARGAEIYERHCGGCHATDGQGIVFGNGGAETRAPDLGDAGYMDGRSDMLLARAIQFGGFRMPAQPHIRGDDLIAVTAYVRSLSRNPVQTVALQGLAQEDAVNFKVVTEAALVKPPAEDWLMFRRTYDSWAHSPLDAINRDNVRDLTLAWSVSMEPGGQYTTPLVRSGVMFVAQPGDVIQALHASTGDLIWEYRRHLAAHPGARNRRNLALLGHRLFHLTDDNHLIALDASTGTLLWEVRETGADEGIGHMAGPTIAGSRVVSGRSCSARGGPNICYVAAHDPTDGRELWRTRTIPRPGEAGDESWGNVPDERRWHIGTWGNVPSYDPDLDFIYWGTSVPQPSLEVLRGTVGLDALHSNSTLVTAASTGEIVWHYQHLPRDNWDLDHTFERYLIDVALAPDPAEVPWINPALRAGDTRRVVTGIPGKTGVVYTLDRLTGEFLWARETLHQNVIESIDGADGRVHVNEDLIVGPFEEILVCPSLGGGKNWPAGTYSPLTGIMYQPQQNMCVMNAGNTNKPSAEDGYALSWVVVEDPAVTADPYPVGRVDAIEMSTGKEIWRHEQRAAMTGTLVSTAGGLVFGGDLNRRFYAFDDRTGEILWQSIVSGPVTGSAISYAVNGRQYIAVAVGGGSASPERRALSVHPEIKPPAGAPALFVFALPD